jgi:hypothetical protein
MLFSNRFCAGCLPVPLWTLNLNQTMNAWSSSSGMDSSRRRSQRVILSVPVTVSGETPKGPFSEDSQTIVVNAHGALIPLAARVAPGQQVQLKSRVRSEKQACTVCYVGPTVDGKTQFGVEFANPAPSFWGIAFPPENWAPFEDSVVPAKKGKS